MQRDTFTWLAYTMLATWAYLQAALGPAMPFLRVELALNYTTAGLHFSAFAFGAVLTGLFSDRWAARFGRGRMLWGCGVALAASSLLLTGGWHPGVTILAAFLMGLFGSSLLVMIQAGLADRHTEQRAIAFTEANIGAMAAAALAPILIGGGQQIGAGWRAAFWAAVVIFVLLLLIFRREPIPESLTSAPAGSVEAQSSPLPRAFWAYWLMLVLGVAVEWCVIYWGADFLENNAGLVTSQAASAMSLFFLGMLTGRISGSLLARRRSVNWLLLVAVITATLGFPLFWLIGVGWLAVTGLFITGLGVANLYPISLAAATAVAPHRASTISARLVLGAGSAVLIVPILLGWLADQTSIGRAFGVVAALLGIMLLLASNAYRHG
jgi:MFS family permease